MAPSQTLVSKLSLFCLLCGPAWAPAQETSAATFSERVDVDLVQLEVTVTDGDGRPVSGLGGDDFQVRYGGKKVDLTLFSGVSSGVFSAAPVVAGESQASADEPTFVVLLVDRDHLDGGLQDDGLAAVRAFVETGLGGDDRVMVLAARGGELEVAQPLTSDAAEVADALRALDLRPSPATASVEYRRLLGEIKREQERPGEDGGALSGEEVPLSIKSQIDALSQKVYRELAQLTLVVDRAITGMAGLPGRKQLVLVTGSLPNQVSKKLNDAWNVAFGNQSVRGSRPSLSASTGGVERMQTHAGESGVQVAQTGELFDLLAGRANAQGVTLHVLGAVGSADTSQRVDDPSHLARLAQRTGGRVVIGNNAERVLEAVRTDLRSYYVLAFSPPAKSAKEAAKDADKAAGPVEVEVKLGKEHKGLELSYREAVRPVNLEERAALAAVSALLLGPKTAENTGGLGITAEPPTEVPGRDDVLRLPVTVLIPLRHITLVQAQEGAVHQGRASLFFTSGDLEGGAGEVQKVVLPIQLGADQVEGIEERNIEYKIDVPMGRKARRVAVALRDDLSGAIVSTSAEIVRLRITP